MRVLCIVLMVCGCGGAEPPASTVASVQVEGWPSIPFPATGMGLRALLDLHTQLEPLPRAAGAGWARDTHGPWVQRRAEILADAAQARRVLRTGHGGAVAVGAALHGSIAATTANHLEDADLRALPTGAASAVRGPIADLRRRAAAAYGVCIDYALSPELAAWRRACVARQRALEVIAPRGRSSRNPLPEVRRDKARDD